ncbi:hypothetical protein A7C91_08605 [Thermococcus piezophilus]|uniref:Helix-turn-helix type 11 domain-containing protein n=2 Tax=Thermococcus piezophilus TaxID=1712654 RepID=A0A172WJN0_9EURY|nr:hypothetical protein A7C91_08605 [Thermococcus piezophilus]
MNIQCESSNIGDCVNSIVLKSRNLLSPKPGFISSSKITLTFGAFMTLTVTVLLDTGVNMKKGILAEYAVGRNKEEAVDRVLEKINRALPSETRVVDFEVGTYTTPITRRTYAVGVVVYNVPLKKRPFREFTIKERRELLANVLEMFNYNQRVLNISEIARIFGVSRDSIYYDIEQILKEKKVSQ